MCNVIKITRYLRYLFLPSVSGATSWMLDGLFPLTFSEFLVVDMAVASGTPPVSSTSTFFSTLSLARQRTTATEKQESVICEVSATWFKQNNWTQKWNVLGEWWNFSKSWDY